MKERIIEFLRAENKSSAQFAEEIGVQPSGISHIISGRNNPSLDFIIKMLDKYKFLSSDWLLFGKGDMYRENQMQKLFNESDVTYSEKESRSDVENNEAIPKIKIVEKVTEPEVKEKQRLTRVVMFYSDGTFIEYLPGND
jgi:transcriptional regulator with XRE-family HTH domain